MTIFETIGMFYVMLATGVFTAALLIAAVWSMVLGVKLVRHRYKLGYDMEHMLREPEAEEQHQR